MEETYTSAKVAVDAVILTIADDETLQVLLRLREKDPDQLKYELIGGLLSEDETAEDALQRKLNEVLGQTQLFFRQFNTFTKPNRDPRGRTISIGFLTLTNGFEIESDPNFQWFEVTNLPPLAFDHQQIIGHAAEFLRDNLAPFHLKHLFPEEFPLNRLQRAYEIIEGKQYDNRNFRKRMIDLEIVEKTNHKQTDVPHRPAWLYRFSKEV